MVQLILGNASEDEAFSSSFFLFSWVNEGNSSKFFNRVDIKSQFGANSGEMEVRVDVKRQTGANSSKNSKRVNVKRQTEVNSNIFRE